MKQLAFIVMLMFSAFYMEASMLKLGTQTMMTDFNDWVDDVLSNPYRR